MLRGLPGGQHVGGNRPKVPSNAKPAAQVFGAHGRLGVWGRFWAICPHMLTKEASKRQSDRSIRIAKDQNRDVTN